MVMQKDSFLKLPVSFAKLDTTVEVDRKNKLARWENTTLKRADPLHLVAKYVKKAFIATNPFAFLQKPHVHQENTETRVVLVNLQNVYPARSDIIVVEERKSTSVMLDATVTRHLYHKNYNAKHVIWGIIVKVVANVFRARLENIQQKKG